jgi:hypothetical protein
MAKVWSAEDIQRTTRGYQETCVIMAGAELDLFAAIGAAGNTAPEIAQAAGGDVRGVTILLDSLAAIGILEKTGAHYRNAPGVADALTAGGRKSYLAMVRHQANCLRRWSRLADTIKAGEPVPLPASVLGEAGDKASFIEAMNDISGPVAGQLVGDIAGQVKFTHVLDVGGASGTYTLAWLAANPAARATLFDLPHVIPMARQRLGDAGMLGRVHLIAGNFETDELPRGADLAWVSAIIHQQSRAENVELFRKCARALPAGGAILIRDIVMDDSHTRPPGGAMFAVNMLSATQSGGTFSLAEIQADLAAAGFEQARQIRDDAWMNSVVLAKKKGD